mmetsp:Transcript_17927/g.29324  ORF Transcript_17927/g.29324 Transcript_17927/m.29324 type:complete len:204 (+) Transcript_17927:40-651(+)
MPLWMWSIFVGFGWTFLLGYCVATALYVCLFGVYVGPEYANSWLKSFFMALGQDLFVGLTVKIIILYLIIPSITSAKVSQTRIKMLSVSAPSVQAARTFPELPISQAILELVGETDTSQGQDFRYRHSLFYSVEEDEQKQHQSSFLQKAKRKLIVALFGPLLFLPIWLQELVVEGAIACGTGLIMLIVFMISTKKNPQSLFAY